jgi:hypothetical protein
VLVIEMEETMTVKMKIKAGADTEEAMARIKENVNLIHTIGKIYTYLLSTSKPTLVKLSQKTVNRVSRIKRYNVIERFKSPAITMDVAVGSVYLPYSNAGSGAYYVRAYHTYRDEFLRKVGDISIISTPTKSYLTIDGKAVDTFPPSTVHE